MTPPDAIDPLGVLRTNDPPVQPDPVFAARLRARLESALSLPARTEAVEMSGTTQVIAELTEPGIAPSSPRPAAIPYLAVADARAAIAWYFDALSAVVVGEPIVMDDGRIGHAELALAGGVLYLADEHPGLGLKAPAPQAVSVSLMLPVADTDTALERARTYGAVVQREIYESYGNRNATFIDPFGHRWMLSGPVRAPSEPIEHGDLGFVSVCTPDADRAAAFYGHVLGWTYDSSTHLVTNTEQPIGMFSVPGSPKLFCCYAVSDLEAAGRAVVNAGGRLGEDHQYGFGTVRDAIDPAGTAFAIVRFNADARRPQLNGAGPGELCYVTYEVGDAAAFRDFYGPLLHWSFEPGRVDDGWQITATHPMAGVAGGSTAVLTVPMWSVADIG
ncbi:MAG: glyoxalase, partial [Mycobacteriaceae bacterium]|nr:glyoxalase [Mycobacteriaceae bacterium]